MGPNVEDFQQTPSLDELAPKAMCLNIVLVPPDSPKRIELSHDDVLALETGSSRKLSLASHPGLSLAMQPHQLFFFDAENIQKG